MSAANGSTVPGETVSDSKGKGKAAEQAQGQSHDVSMDEDEDSSAEESGNEEPVSRYILLACAILHLPFHVLYITIVSGYKLLTDCFSQMKRMSKVDEHYPPKHGETPPISLTSSLANLTLFLKLKKPTKTTWKRSTPPTS